jgi:hypothetical protein
LVLQQSRTGNLAVFRYCLGGDGNGTIQRFESSWVVCSQLKDSLAEWLQHSLMMSILTSFHISWLGLNGAKRSPRRRSHQINAINSLSFVHRIAWSDPIEYWKQLYEVSNIFLSL